MNGNSSLIRCHHELLNIDVISIKIMKVTANHMISVEKKGEKRRKKKKKILVEGNEKKDRVTKEIR